MIELYGKRILVLQGDGAAGRRLAENLRDEGFAVYLAGTLAEAVGAADRHDPDLLILDLALPGGNGLDAYRRICAAGMLPTIVLTERAEETDCIIALELGVDDCVSKPFSARELVARIRAVLRRTPEQPRERSGAQALCLGEIAIDESAHEVRLAGCPVDLTPTEFRILQILAHHHGQVLTRGQLRTLIGKGDGYERTLDRHVNNIRQKVEADPKAPAYIKTVYGVGYKMVGTVTSLAR